MSITYGFFNSSNGDRKYNAEDIGRYLMGLVSDGVYADTSTSLQVLAGDGMQVEVQTGRAMLANHWLLNDSPLTLELSTGGTQARVDAIVMRLSMDRRLCEIAVKAGTPAASPVAPTMLRNDHTKEYMLASVYVAPLATSISQENITDTRANTAVCGWVTGLITQVDTSTLFTQWQTAYEGAYARMIEYLTAKRDEYDAWFAALTQDLQVLTYIQEYRNSVTIEVGGTRSLTIGIENYDPDVDVLFVNLHGMTLQKEDYTVTGSGSTAVCTLNVDTTAGHVVEFRVLKSEIGSAPAAATFALDGDTGNVLTDGDGSALTL